MANKIDISSFQIAASKMRADGNAYFKLFEKHIPRNLDMNNVVLLYKLDNLSCIYNIINMNSKTHYVVVSNTAVNTALRAVLDKAIDVKYIEELDFKKTDMKFDCIIMNPPYTKNLHLKILAEAIKHLNDDESKCVNLSPVRWLQDPLAKYKKNSDYHKFEDSVSKHIESLDVILSKDAEKMFNISLPFNLGIYCLKNKITKFEFPLTKSQIYISELVKRFNNTLANHIVFSVPNNYAVVLSMMCGGSGNRTEDADGSWFAFNKKTFEQYCYLNNARLDNGLSYYDNRKLTCWGNVKPRSEQNNIQFNSENEARNFYNSCNTQFFKFVFKSIMVDVHVHPEFLPWMGDSINPRTGKKGYESEWTDDDFVRYFNITPEEQKVIEETMEKYK